MAEVTEMFSAPLTFNWTLSYRCNFTCEHCYSRDEQCPELATADVKRIIDLLISWWSSRCHLSTLAAVSH
jgi:MoaA/NifB/PqqE/SkfB family radical SAM enzyme